MRIHLKSGLVLTKEKPMLDGLAVDFDRGNRHDFHRETLAFKKKGEGVLSPSKAVHDPISYDTTVS